MVHRFSSRSELEAFVGKEVGPSDWITVTQQAVDLFAQATGDHQWIHLDAERARRESPFGGTVAHGFLTLSLLPVLMASAVDIAGTKAKVNLGLNRVRFTAPVPVGARLRLRAVLLLAEAEKDQSLRISWSVTFEIEGSAKPVCVAESLGKLYFDPEVIGE